MPWQTPSLEEVRKQNRDYVTAHLHASAMVPNSVLRVLSDANAGLAFLTLLYIDWLAKQLLPDTAETEWLDRHADIWLPGAGRKPATFASGTGTATGIEGSVLPNATQLTGANGVLYETTEEIIVGAGPTPVAIRAVDPGALGNLDPESTISFVGAIPGIDGFVIIVDMQGGVDIENDDDLRERVLERIRQPPMGGAAYDYVAWAKQVPGVTRAWAASEQGVGTVTVRFMMDDLRADNDGFPLPDDELAVTAYIDTVRPVTVKDFWALGPLKQPIYVTITDLVPNDEATRAAIDVSLKDMLLQLASPGQTIFAAWKSHAVMEAPSVVSFSLIDNEDDVMPSIGHMAVLDTVIYV